MATQHTSSSATKTGGASRNKPAPSRGPSSAASAERDEVYGLVSVLYHALQGAETYDQYVRDARNADDQELVEFFEECRDEEADRADRAKSLLAARMDGFGGMDRDTDEEDEEDEEEDEG